MPRPLSRRRSLLALLATWSCSVVFAQQATPAPSRVAGLSQAAWQADIAEPTQRVVFHGELDQSQPGSAGGSMIYPAPNLVGFLAAVLTHAALVEGAKSSQREKAIADADRVLEPLAPVLSNFTGKDLSRLLRLQLQRPGESVPDWQVDVAPVFVFSRDLRSLSVEAHLQARRVGAQEPGARTSIRATLPTVPQADAAAHWTSQQGQALHDQAARVLALAVQTGVRDMSGEWDQVQRPARTVRFLSGGTERIERVQVLEARCGEALVRHLRGDLMVIPWQDPQRQEACEAPVPVPAATASAASAS